jgi:hypothetical protein
LVLDGLGMEKAKKYGPMWFLLGWCLFHAGQSFSSNQTHFKPFTIHPHPHSIKTLTHKTHVDDDNERKSTKKDLTRASLDPFLIPLSAPLIHQSKTLVRAPRPQ